MAGPIKAEQGVPPPPEIIPTTKLLPLVLALKTGGIYSTARESLLSYLIADGEVIVDTENLTLVINEDGRPIRTLPLKDTITISPWKEGQNNAAIVFPPHSVVMTQELESDVLAGERYGVFVVLLVDGHYDYRFYPYENGNWPKDISQAAVHANELRMQSGDTKIYEF